jgi:hypothetical protein
MWALGTRDFKLNRHLGEGAKAGKDSKDVEGG